jgi:hypothetical protein
VRAPDTAKEFDALAYYGTLSAVHWRDIAAALAKRGVDLDTEMVGERPLREVLQVMAWYHGAVARLPRPATPHDETGADWIGDDRKHDRHGVCHPK